MSTSPGDTLEEVLDEAMPGLGKEERAVALAALEPWRSTVESLLQSFVDEDPEWSRDQWSCIWPDDAAEAARTAVEKLRGRRSFGGGVVGPPITSDDYIVMQAQLVAVGHVIKDWNLEAFIAAIDREETPGPVLDPDLWKGLEVTVKDLRKLADTMRGFQEQVHQVLMRSGLPSIPGF